MNKILTLIFILFIGFSFSQINQVDAQGRKQGKWGKKYPKKQVFQYMGQFKNDKPVGKFVYRYESNKIKAIINHFSSGRSEAYLYHANGKMMSFGIYQNQEKDSIWTNYSPSQRLSNKETYKNGKLNGTKVVYYVPENPQMKTKAKMKVETYDNGALTGPFYEYFPDGVMKSKGNYKNGYFEGLIIRFHPNGEKEIEMRYKNGDKHGWWKTYNNQGKEIARRYFYNGKEYKGEKLKAKMAKLKALGKNPNE